MSTFSLAIRSMSRSELDLAIDWAAAEGWNPGLFDANPFYATDPEGFLIGTLGKQPVAVISAVKYGPFFGFIGLYIVNPTYRGQGYGWKMWQAAMERLAGRNIGLDGVIAQQNNYRHSGFIFHHRNIRYRKDANSISPLPISQEGLSLVPLTSIPAATVTTYGQDFFPAERTDFLRFWIGQPQTRALGALYNNHLVGYGVIRRCRDGYRIGPLYANEPELAATLLNALGSELVRDESIFLDIPETNRAAISLAESNGMSLVFETARMYRGNMPDIGLDRTYGITSFELG
jgi:GNAT superfamily N-acetyltransferase